MSLSRLPNIAVCIYSHSSVETTKSASVRMQFGYVIPIPANSCQCAKSVERRYTLVMHGVCEMSSSLHTITLSTRLSPTGHRGQLINLTCRLPNIAVCIYSHSSVETTKSASVRMQFGYVIPIPANSCQCAKSVERRYTLVMHGVCEMSSSLHTITLSTRLSPTGHRGQLINLTCRVFHGNCEECISAFKGGSRILRGTLSCFHTEKE